VEQQFVSFVIPVLNGEKDIHRCLLSIRKQVFPSKQFEVIVVDNGSSDRTHQIVRDFGYNIEVVPGVSVAALRNRGAKLAQGSYLGFVDADVELGSVWVRNGLAAFEDEHVVAAGCFPKAPRPGTWVQQTWEIHQCGRQNGNIRCPVTWLPSMNLIVRREVFLEVHGFNEQLVTAEDVDLCYRLGKHGTILSVPAMEAVHWGEAADLKTFWRKEIWRGTGNLRGLIFHGFRWDELPSLGYPFYVLCVFVLLGVSCVTNQSRNPILVNLTLLALPALVLATRTSYRTKQIRSLPNLFLLYFVYGIARAYALVKGCVHNSVR
jgi:glycosyltransferase involved in cell wall biosynthesis